MDNNKLIDGFYAALKQVNSLRENTKGRERSRLDSFAHTASVAISCAIEELEASGATCPANDGLGLPGSEERFFAAQQRLATPAPR